MEEKTKEKTGGVNRIPTIALSTRWHWEPERSQWIAAHNFAAEYTLNPSAPLQLAQHVDPLLAAGVPVRYHGFFPHDDLGHQDPVAAENALGLQSSALEAILGRGEQVITVHIGLSRETPLDPGRAVENLTRLSERARQLNITVCLENLRYGPTSNPEVVLTWAKAAGAEITLDVGHAVTSPRVLAGELTVLDYIDIFDGRIFEAHIYERETDRHHPPQDMSILGPIVDRLQETPCNWWTIELTDYAEALSTRTLLLAYLANKN
jgi:sugar phosphate isomerase/epimerase